MEEEGSEADSSNTETFVALKVYIDNWRWAGVPFYLRTGKRMKEKVTQVVITYKDSPHAIFVDDDGEANNRLLGCNQMRVSNWKWYPKSNVWKSVWVLKTHSKWIFDDNEDSRIADAYERLFQRLLTVISGFLLVEMKSKSLGSGVTTYWPHGQIKRLLPSPTVQVLSSKAEVLIETSDRSWYEHK